MRFGLNISTSAEPGSDPVGDARRAEALGGFDFVSITDHLHGTSPTYETWTLLSWIAAATTRIGVATRVLAVPYRSPAVLAKMAESFDRLSGGRLILGLGGGAFDDEFRAFGLGDRSPREKIDGLADAVQIMRGMWSRPAFGYDGPRYRVAGAELTPKPDRRIPIWLGTFGPRGLALTGRLADGWIPSLGHASPDRIPAMRERVLAAAREAGRDPAEITCAYNVPVRFGGPADADVVVGTPEEVAERLTGFAGLGFTALNLIAPDPDGVEVLAREVIPAVRSATDR